MEPSDRNLVDLLRRGRALNVSELGRELGVTATAVRQRLQRLLASGLIARERVASARGRPSYRYGLTERGRREAGTNFADLAVVLWSELRSIADPDVRRGLLQRIMARLSEQYSSAVQGATARARMLSVANLLQERQVPFSVDEHGGLPVLKAHACPYTELAEQDRSVCAMERMLFSKLVGEPLRLTECRLDGQPCCTFELHSPVPEFV